MKEEIRRLFEIQKYETIRDDILLRLEEIPVLIEEENLRINYFMQEIQEAKDSVKKLNLLLNEQEIELKSVEDEIRKSSEQLNTLKSNESYSAMQEKIAKAKNKIDLIEDEMLAIYEKIEEANAVRKSKEQLLEQVKVEVEDSKNQHRKTEEKLKNNLYDVEKKLEPLIPTVERELLEEYRKVRSARQGVAIVAVENGSCGGCHIKLRPQILNEVMQEEKMVSCDSCSRFLYLED